MGKSSSAKRAHVKLDRTSMQEAVKLLDPDLKSVIRDGIEEYVASAAKYFLEVLMSAEVTERCGEKYKRDAQRKFVRWGYEKGIARVCGGTTEVCRPRIRVARNLSDEGCEVVLETYKAMNRAELMDGPLNAAIFSGVSARKYATIVQRGLMAKGISKSSISRKTIAATKPMVDQFLRRQLDELDLVVLLIDGIHIGNKQMLVCMGIEQSGRKRVLAVRAGATENDIVCRDLIRDMIDRGLSNEQKYLFVIDGSKALVKAIHAAFGQDVPIQRCQEHKIRNVQAYVPVRNRQEIRSKMQAAYNQKSEKVAANRLAKLRTELSILAGEKAVNALTEGMYETLTVHRLGLTGSLRTSLRTTNIIESVNASMRRYMGNVTNYQNDAQIERWAIRSLIEAERHLRTVQGNRQLSDLRKALSKI